MSTQGRRHLPVLSGPSRARRDAPEASSDATVDAPPDEPAPWHWIPLGATVSVVTFALLAQGVAKAAVALLSRVYGPSATAAQVARVRAAHPLGGALAEAAPGLLSVLALLASVALGGYFLGRYGARTTPRHGTLSGALTLLLLWVVTGRPLALLLFVPLGGAVGWLAARGGERARTPRPLTPSRGDGGTAAPGLTEQPAGITEDEHALKLPPPARRARGGRERIG